MSFLLLIAGLHTVQGSLVWSIIYLAGNPDQRRKIVEDHAVLPTAVEEILRFEAAVAPARGATVPWTTWPPPYRPEHSEF